MEWWRWIAAAVEGALLLIMVLLRADNRRSLGRPAGHGGRSRGVILAAAIVLIGMAVMFLVPIWVALILIGIPALAVAALALAS